MKATARNIKKPRDFFLIDRRRKCTRTYRRRSMTARTRFYDADGLLTSTEPRALYVGRDEIIRAVCRRTGGFFFYCIHTFFNCPLTSTIVEIARDCITYIELRDACTDEQTTSLVGPERSTDYYILL